MPANGAAAWFKWVPPIQAALQPGAPVSHDDLLLVRDRAGQLVRRFEPVSYTHLTLPTSDLV